VLPDRVRKSGKVAGYNQVGRSLIGKRSGKLFGQDSVNSIRYVSGHDKGSGSGKVLGNMPGYDSGKVPGSNSDKELGTISDKDPSKRPEENLGMVIHPGMNV
jgi:hypothetical protein